MDRVQNILLVSDGFLHTQRAEARAAILSRELRADILEMMTVKPTTMGLRTAATMFHSTRVNKHDAKLLADSGSIDLAHLSQSAGASVAYSIRVGDPAQAIVSRAEEMNADLTIVTAPVKTFFTRLFSRHPNDRLLRKIQRPLLLVNAEPRTSYRQVIVAVDFSAASRAAARIALAIAPSARMTFVHAVWLHDEPVMREFELPGDVIRHFRRRACESGRDKLNDFIQTLGPSKQLITQVVEHSRPLPLVAACARRLQADLIVVGKHSKPRIEELLLGSTTQKLLRESQCDLLAVPPVDEDDY